MPPLRDDQETFTFLFGIPNQRILPLFSNYSMASIQFANAAIANIVLSQYYIFTSYSTFAPNGVHCDLEIDFLRRPPNDADWEGGMVIIQKVG